MNGVNLTDLGLLVAGADSGRHGLGADPRGPPDSESAAGRGRATVLASLAALWPAFGSCPAATRLGSGA